MEELFAQESYVVSDDFNESTLNDESEYYSNPDFDGSPLSPDCQKVMEIKENATNIIDTFELIYPDSKKEIEDYIEKRYLKPFRYSEENSVYWLYYDPAEELHPSEDSEITDFSVRNLPENIDFQMSPDELPPIHDPFKDIIPRSIMPYTDKQFCSMMNTYIYLMSRCQLFTLPKTTPCHFYFELKTKRERKDKLFSVVVVSLIENTIKFLPARSMIRKMWKVSCTEAIE